MRQKPLVPQIDEFVGRARRWLKPLKARRERRRAKRNPECVATYRRYAGWAS